LPQPPLNCFTRVRWLFAVLLALALIRTFIIEPCMVPTSSMEGTVLVGDYLLLNRLPYGPRVPFTPWRLPHSKQLSVGDIVALRFTDDPKTGYLKRVIATGGDTIEIRHDTVYVNGLPLAEPYAIHRRRIRTPESMSPRFVPPGRVFVMGDNRDFSSDSRERGTVPAENVSGKALVVFWSYHAPASLLLDEGLSSRLQLYTAMALQRLRHARWARVGHRL
jgi:signal peptidase I